MVVVDRVDDEWGGHSNKDYSLLHRIETLIFPKQKSNEIQSSAASPHDFDSHILLLVVVVVMAVVLEYVVIEMLKARGPSLERIVVREANYFEDKMW